MHFMPWKWDQVLWDEDRYYVSVGREFQRLADGSLAIQLRATGEQSYCNDVYHADKHVFQLRTTDGGLTWGRYDGPVLDESETRLRDGKTRVLIRTGGATTMQHRRDLLVSIGADPESVSEDGNDLWPESHAEALRAEGYVVEPSMPGIVGTCQALTCRRSFDDGRTFESRRIDLPHMARTYGSFRRCIELADGSLLAACTGRWKAADGEFCYALRSTDQGGAWNFHVIAEDKERKLQFNETDILQLPGGRVIAMIRCHRYDEPIGNFLYQATSDDGGVTWTAFVRTPMWGYPAQMILLNDGKTILCTYAHRRHPYGSRACLSRDGGQTWDIENEKILKDDSLPGLVWYPTSVQLDDGTILTAHSGSKIPWTPYHEGDKVGPNDDLLVHTRRRVGPERRWHGGYHGYALVSRYTLDWVRNPGRVTSSIGAYRCGTGHDEE
jgi:hypothetical protein